MKIGLFGGSFNPIHNDHIRIIKYLVGKKIIDQVWIIPCKNHVFNKDLLPVEERIKMIKLAITKIKRVKINTIELETTGKSYAINTIRKLKKIGPQHNFFFIAGSDILHEIKRWHKYEDILKEIDFIIFKRVGYDVKNIRGLNITHLIEEKPSSISSSEIREKIEGERSLKNFIPFSVYDYLVNKKIKFNQA